MLKVVSITTATLASLIGSTVVAIGLDASNGQPLRGKRRLEVGGKISPARETSPRGRARRTD